MLNQVSAKEGPLFFTSALVFLMLATRTHHFGSALHLPDASLAIFFIAGYRLRHNGFFALFCAIAACIDFLTIAGKANGSFCLTPSYAFLLPAYFSVWCGGRLSNSVRLSEFKGWLQLSLIIFISLSLAFLVSNGSFYWLSGRFEQTTISEYITRAVRYYPHYMIAPLGYLAVASIIQWAFSTFYGRQTDHA